MNTPILLNGLSYGPLTPGNRYRLSGYIRGGVPDGSALTNAGFDPATAKSWGTVGVPSDWPTEDLPPSSSDEQIFRFEGTWIGSGTLPSSIQTNNGTFLIYQVWLYIAPLENVNLVQPSTIEATLTIGIIVLALGLAGLWMSVGSNTLRTASTRA